MLVQAKHIDLLHAQSSSLWVAGSSRDCDTEVVRLTGARGRVGEPFIDLFVPERLASGLLRYLAESPKISVLCSAILTFETFQIKGRFISSRASTTTELQWQRAYLEQLGQTVVSIGIKSGCGFRNYYSEPALTLRMQAEEIYDQTPKPGAGKKIA